MYNLVFESTLYKGTSKILWIFELFLRFNQVQMRGELILHVIHIAGTGIIGAGIDGLSRVNTLVGMIKELKPLQFVPLYQGALGNSAELEPWLRTWKR